MIMMTSSENYGNLKNKKTEYESDQKKWSGE